MLTLSGPLLSLHKQLRNSKGEKFPSKFSETYHIVKRHQVPPFYASKLLKKESSLVEADIKDAFKLPHSLPQRFLYLWGTSVTKGEKKYFTIGKEQPGNKTMSQNLKPNFL